MRKIIGIYIVIGIILLYAFFLLGQSTEETTVEIFDTSKYQIEAVLDQVCEVDNQCVTPFDYLIQSRCPFTSKCLDNQCTVICPEF